MVLDRGTLRPSPRDIPLPREKLGKDFFYLHSKTLTNGCNPHFEVLLISFSVCLCHLLEEAKDFNPQT